MDEKIDIFILSNTLKTGGAEKQSILLSKQLTDVYNVNLIIYYGNETDVRYIDLVKKYNINVTFLSGSNSKKLWYLFKLFKKNKHSIIFSYLATTNIINGVLGSLSGIKLRIGGIRNSKFEKKKIYVQRFLHNYLLTASVFNNYSGLNELEQKGFISNKTYVIPNCIQIEETLKKDFKSIDEIKIITVSRFVPQKDYETALQSIYQLESQLNGVKRINFRYIIIGFGELENSIRNKIEELNLSEIVEIHVNPAEVKEFFKKADIYLSTSLFEGLSNSIMEAMEFSLPIVATNVGDNNRLIKENVNGHLTNVRDYKAIASHLMDLLLNQKKRFEMGKKSYEILSHEYSERIFKQRYINIIEKLMNEHSYKA